MIGVIVLLQVRRLNRAFFDLVELRSTTRSGQPRRSTGLGHEFFKFWVKNPL